MENVYFENCDDYNINKNDNVKVIIFCNGKMINIKNSSNQNNNLLKYKKINNTFGDTFQKQVDLFEKRSIIKKSSWED